MTLPSREQNHSVNMNRQQQRVLSRRICKAFKYASNFTLGVNRGTLIGNLLEAEKRELYQMLYAEFGFAPENLSQTFFRKVDDLVKWYIERRAWLRINEVILETVKRELLAEGIVSELGVDRIHFRTVLDLEIHGPQIRRVLAKLAKVWVTSDKAGDDLLKSPFHVGDVAIHIRKYTTVTGPACEHEEIQLETTVVAGAELKVLPIDKQLQLLWWMDKYRIEVRTHSVQRNDYSVVISADLYVSSAEFHLLSGDYVIDYKQEGGYVLALNKAVRDLLVANNIIED